MLDAPPSHPDGTIDEDIDEDAARRRIEAAAVRRRMQADPAWFLSRIVGAEPWAKQIEIAESVRDHPRTAVASAHACGKSWSAGRIALWFLSAFENSVVITTAPTDRQVRNILWKEIRAAHSAASRRVFGGLGGSPSSQRLEISEEWYAIGFTANDPDKFQGFHSNHVLVIVDEAVGVSSEIFEAIDSILASGATARLLCIGNPTNKDTAFGKMFDEPDSNVNKIEISVYDTPNFTTFGITEADIVDGSWQEKIGDAKLPAPHLAKPSWAAGMAGRYGISSPVYLARARAKFPTTSDDGLTPLPWIDEANRRHMSVREWTGPATFAADIARFGADRTVLCVKRDQGIQRIWKWSQASTTETTARIRAEVDLFTGADVEEIRIDAVGLGSGVADQLRQLYGERVIDMNPSHRPAIEETAHLYENQRAEWFWNIRTLLDPEAQVETRPAFPEDEDLAAQLVATRWKLNKRTSKFQMESKDDMRARGLPSPDEADAVAMALAPMPRREEVMFV